MAYSDLVLSDSPIAFWSLDGDSLTANEVIGGLSGSVTGTIRPGSTALSQAILGAKGFGIFGSGIFVPDQDVLTPASGLTLCCFARIEGVTSTQQALAGKQKAGTTYPEYSIQLSSVGKLSALLSSASNAAAQVTINDPNAFPSGFHFVALKWDGTTARLRIDKVEVANGAFAGPIYNSAAEFGMAGNDFSSSYSYPLNGTIFGVALFGHALSDARLDIYCDAGFAARSVPGVVKIDGVAAQRTVRVYGREKQVLLGEAVSSATDGTFSVPINYDGAVDVLAFDEAGEYWSASVVYYALALAFPTVPNGHYYKTTSGGTSASTEPSWPTDGTTVTDGTVTWTDQGAMHAPLIQGPFIPVAI